MKTVQLLPIDQAGHCGLDLAQAPEMLRENCAGTAAYYGVIGFQPPWIGFVCVDNGVTVGGGAFKGAPKDNTVEIAYYTLPQFENHGYASATARALVQLARETLPGVMVTAMTLATPNASNHLLQKLGFTFAGAIVHPEDGEIWEWRLPA